MSMKTSNEPATSRLVAQRLKQLHHRVPLGCARNTVQMVQLLWSLALVGVVEPFTFGLLSSSGICLGQNNMDVRRRSSSVSVRRGVFEWRVYKNYWEHSASPVCSSAVQCLYGIITAYYLKCMQHTNTICSKARTFCVLRKVVRLVIITI